MFFSKRSFPNALPGVRPIPLAEVFITMHRSYDGMGGTQVSDRPQTNANVEPQQDAIASGDLLQGQRQVWINHDGTLYCLKATSNGRLYLTK